MNPLQPHQHILSDRTITLRPLTEADWDTLYHWNNDPIILYYVEGADVSSMAYADMQAIYRTVATTGVCFMIEHDGLQIGDCWLQPMNLPRILNQFPKHDIRRIDLTIGRSDLWGKGIGTTTIRLLTAFAFASEHADTVFGCDIADYNQGSLQAFRNAGYTEFHCTPQQHNKAAFRYDLGIMRVHYLGLTAQQIE
jgi:RimJ/RimL family protein N-acetyltransferase